METKRHLATLPAVSMKESLGPAEGQYATFQGTMETTGDCYDYCTVFLGGAPDEFCMEVALASALTEGVLRFDLYFWGDCSWVDGGSGSVAAGETGDTLCVSGPLPAGSYSVLISASGVTPPIPYTVRIEPSVPILGTEQINEEICGDPSCM